MKSSFVLYLEFNRIFDDSFLSMYDGSNFNVNQLKSKKVLQI